MYSILSDMFMMQRRRSWSWQENQRPNTYSKLHISHTAPSFCLLWNGERHFHLTPCRRSISQCYHPDMKWRGAASSGINSIFQTVIQFMLCHRHICWEHLWFVLLPWSLFSPLLLSLYSQPGFSVRASENSGGWSSSSRGMKSKTDGGKCDVCAVADAQHTQSFMIKYRPHTTRELDTER